MSPQALHTVARTVTIVNMRGLHARAAARFVKLAGQFDAAVAVSKSGVSVPGQSLMGLLMLGAGQGSEIVLEASGPAAQAAVDALAALIADRFGEGE
jgi:phosphocarrier protein HPr